MSITKLFYAEDRRRGNSLQDMIMGKELRQSWIEIALDVTFVNTQERLFRTCKIIYKDSGSKTGRSKKFPGLPM